MAKIEIFQIHIEYSSTTIWVKNSVEIALSLTVSEILTFLGFPQKSKMAVKTGEKIEIFQFCIGYFAITLRVKNSVKITLLPYGLKIQSKSLYLLRFPSY